MNAVLLALLMVLFGANQATPGVLSVTINEDELVLPVGGTATLTAAVATTGGASADVRWFSDDPAVVAVDSSGTVTALAAGTAIVTAVSDVSAVRSDSVRVAVSDEDSTSLEDVGARVEPGGRIALNWTSENAVRIEIGCDGDPGRPLATVAGDASGATIDIPASTCRTLRVLARGAPVDATAFVEPQNVVWTGADAPLGESPIPGSLRAVLADADAGAVIGFAADVRDVALAGKAFSGPNDAHLVLDRDVILSAASDDPVTIRSDDALPADARGIPVRRTRVLYVAPTASARLEGLVIRGGTFNASGAAIRNDGVLTISKSLLEDNLAFYRGGAIHNLGTLLIEDSTIRNNRAIVTDAVLAAGFACIDDVTRGCSEGDGNYLHFGRGGSGGGIYNEAGITRLVNSVVSANTAIYSGGGVYVAAGRVELIESQVRDNVASDEGVAYDTYSFGGGIANFSSAGVAMTRGAVAGNTSGDVGGGLSNGGTADPDLPMTLRDVRIEGNVAGSYGGGFMQYFVANRESLQEFGATEATGNVAGGGPGGDDGDDRYFEEVTR